MQNADHNGVVHISPEKKSSLPHSFIQHVHAVPASSWQLKIKMRRKWNLFQVFFVDRNQRTLPFSDQNVKQEKWEFQRVSDGALLWESQLLSTFIAIE